MVKDTKKIDFSIVLSNWHYFIDWLKTIEDESLLQEGIEYELSHQCRPTYIDRLRTRFNKVRNIREL